MAPTNETQIANLLYRYAELIDTGDLAGMAALFAHSRLKFGSGDPGTIIDSAGLLDFFSRGVFIYPDGTPRTKHVTTNPIIEVDEEAGTATCRSYYTVFQQVDGFPLHPVAAGRYHDRFEQVDGVWRFSFRDYSLLHLMGDMSRHFALGEQPGPTPTQ